MEQIFESTDASNLVVRIGGMMWRLFSLVIPVFIVTESRADSGFDLNRGGYTCHFSQPQYTASEVEQIAEFQACRKQKIEPPKVDLSKFGNCAPPAPGSDLKTQGRLNRAWLCADPHYDQRDCLQEASVDPSFKEVIVACRKRREIEVQNFQTMNRLRVELDASCAKKFARGYSLSSVEECRAKVALPPPPTRP